MYERGTEEMEQETQQNGPEKRPYIICHILSSLDGKISGPFMGTPEAQMIGEAYGKIRSAMCADAWMYGTVTTKEFTNNRRPVLEEAEEVPEGDFIADAGFYYVSVDTDGEIGWESGTMRMPGRPDAHVIEILTESVPLSYRDYLRKRGVSYILAGKEKLDCALAMEKLGSSFSVKKLLLCGGGIVNWSFLAAGMIDELSLLLAPVTDGSSGTAALFTKIPELAQGAPVSFTLDAVERIGAGGLHLSYRVNRN